MLTIAPFKSTALSSFYEKRELREFKRDIEYARNRTIIELNMYSVKIYPSQNTYTINNHGSTGRQVVKKKVFSKGIKIKSTNIKDNEIPFSFTGHPFNSGTIVLEDSQGREIEITVSLATGKVNIAYR